MSSKSPKVSILVPIYNVEKYLRQCLESLVNQTLHDIEIICLNDGSTDSSPKIIQEFQKSDSRIRVINKKNSGYGDSMNQGLKKATGEYIGIVESDDFIDLDAFEKLYQLATTNNAEVVRANYYYNKSGKDKKNYYINPVDAGRIIDPSRHTWIFYEAPAIWSALYKRSFLNQNHIDFLPTPGASYQDTGFNFKVWSSAKRAYFTTEAFLHYRIDNEASSVNNPGKVMNVCYEYAEIEKYLRKNHLFDQFSGIMEASKFGSYYWNLFRLNNKLLPDFINVVRKEYQTANQDGLLSQTYFENYKWQLLQYILRHKTWRVALHIRWLKFKLAFREQLKKLWGLTHPSYRKAQKTSELIAELYASSDLLESKVQLFRQQLSELNHSLTISSSDQSVTSTNPKSTVNSQEKTK